jgi:hypothetical protein
MYYGTVISGVEPGDLSDGELCLSEFGAEEFNSELLSRMEEIFPEGKYVVVPGGPWSEAWQKLTGEERFDTATGEELELASEIREQLIATPNVDWWVSCHRDLAEVW